MNRPRRGVGPRPRPVERGDPLLTHFIAPNNSTVYANRAKYGTRALGRKPARARMLHRLKGSPLNTEFLNARNNLIYPLLSLRSPESEEFKCATAKGRHASIMQKFHHTQRGHRYLYGLFY